MSEKLSPTIDGRHSPHVKDRHNLLYHLAANCKDYREVQGLSQRALARRAHVPMGAVVQLEQKHKDLRVRHLVAIAQALGLKSPGCLFLEPWVNHMQAQQARAYAMKQLELGTDGELGEFLRFALGRLVKDAK